MQDFEWKKFPARYIDALTLIDERRVCVVIKSLVMLECASNFSQTKRANERKKYRVHDRSIDDLRLIAIDAAANNQRDNSSIEDGSARLTS